MRISKLALALCVGSLFAAPSVFAASVQACHECAPNGKGQGVEASDVHQNANPHHGGGGNGISYHGGPVILGTTNVHFIWYGQSSWPNSTQKSILENYPSSVGGSGYFNINTTYYDGSNNHVSNSVHFSGSVGHSETYGTSLSDAQIKQIVADTNPTDTNGVYFVLTGPDVTASSGF